MRVPDLALLFDLPAEVAMARMNAGRFIQSDEKNEKFEKLEFLQKARNGFLELSKIFPKEPVHFVDAELYQEHIFENIKPLLDKVVRVD